MRFPVLLFPLVLSQAAAAEPLSRPNPPSAPPRLEWAPERPVQGHLFVVRVVGSSATDAAALSGRVAGEALHFVRADDGAFESLAPVPVDARGSVAVVVVVPDGAGGSGDLRADVPVDAVTYHHERLDVAPELGAPLKGAAAARLARDQEKAAGVARRAHETPRLWRSAAVMPRRARVTGGFGDGRIFNGQVSSRHLGLDLNGNVGDTVRAAERGVVALVDDFLLAGNIVYVVHGGGLLSGYFHLSRQLVAVGDTVEAGAPIGLVGATGRVTGPHLHWVVRYGTTSVDPRSLLEVTGR
jgi:hypothetical protein